MSTLTITNSGQITLGKELLEHMGVHPGEKVTINKLANGRIEMKASGTTGNISDVFGFLKRNGQPSLSIRRLNEIAARGWVGKR